jgi:hypothetical protein
MSREVLTVLTDDLDGSSVDGVETLPFMIGNTKYEIDLSPENRDHFAAAMAPFVAAAHEISRVTGARMIRKPGNTVVEAPRPAAVPVGLLPKKTLPPGLTVVEKPLAEQINGNLFSDAPGIVARKQRARIDPVQSRAIRDWAAHNGYALHPKRPIPQEVLDAFQEAKAPVTRPHK